MSGFERADDHVWGRFFEFVYSCEPKSSRQEVQADLQRRGIDVKPAISAVLDAVARRKARASLEAARKARPSVTDAISRFTPPVPDNLRESLHQLIATRFEGTDQAAYFHKLEKANDEDLESMLADLQRVEKLLEEKDDDTAE